MHTRANVYAAVRRLLGLQPAARMSIRSREIWNSYVFRLFTLLYLVIYQKLTLYKEHAVSVNIGHLFVTEIVIFG